MCVKFVTNLYVEIYKQMYKHKFVDFKFTV